ncbi:hypothetical protein MPTK1_7g03070 [Marchantia polymorpha subsp. ruderalis]|uniref:Uncharacterized protein n=2 Tax=Marchantia polymorpha TaxID=3197 RepID=A0AAF6BVL4_MARPO|nr:hypothetical protein MARPO_0074s0089 [Marchantia polymorpha]BBN16048.1 hypothetical protein Mp_7g03070 [Marchantia polymorpha subsp. ruderalis]|eukprot:PTQ35117.1 hypothetical protein MARPO_0074s0089 [Marchantia polymorpha]
MDCTVESAWSNQSSSPSVLSTRLASLFPLSDAILNAQNITVEESTNMILDEIRSVSKQGEPTPASPFTKPPEKAPLSVSSDYATLSNSLANRQIWAGPKDTVVKKPVYKETNKDYECEQPYKIQAVSACVELSPEQVGQENECKVEEPAWLRVPVCSGRCHGVQLKPMRTVVKPNSPSPTVDLNLDPDESKAWDPERSQHLKRKHCKWAVAAAGVQASGGPRQGPVGGRGCNNNPAQPSSKFYKCDERAQIPCAPSGAQCFASPYGHLRPGTFLPVLFPVPGDIIISQQCRTAELNNPLYNPGGHVRFHFDPTHFTRSAAMRNSMILQDYSQAQAVFQNDDLIIRAGAFEANYIWTPQDNVELFRHVLLMAPYTWLFCGRCPFKPLGSIRTFGLGAETIPFMEMHQFPPERRMVQDPNTTRWIGSGFRPESTDLIITLSRGMADVTISYFHWQTTHLSQHDMLIRASYTRVEDTTLGTVDMFMYLMNPATQQLMWNFQGRDVQLFGGSVSLEHLIQIMDLATPMDGYGGSRTQQLAQCYNPLQGGRNTGIH